MSIRSRGVDGCHDSFDGPVTFDRRVRVAEAVHGAHRTRLIHRALKPPNVMVEHRDEIAVSNPNRHCRSMAVTQRLVGPVDPRAIPLVNDAATHHVRLLTGDEPRPVKQL